MALALKVYNYVGVRGKGGGRERENKGLLGDGGRKRAEEGGSKIRKDKGVRGEELREA